MQTLSIKIFLFKFNILIYYKWLFTLVLLLIEEAFQIITIVFILLLKQIMLFHHQLVVILWVIIFMIEIFYLKVIIHGLGDYKFKNP
jgi:hypothetical protein